MSNTHYPPDRKIEFRQYRIEFANPNDGDVLKFHDKIPEYGNGNVYARNDIPLYIARKLVVQIKKGGITVASGTLGLLEIGEKTIAEIRTVISLPKSERQRNLGEAPEGFFAEAIITSLTIRALEIGFESGLIGLILNVQDHQKGPLNHMRNVIKTLGFKKIFPDQIIIDAFKNTVPAEDTNVENPKTFYELPLINVLKSIGSLKIDPTSLTTTITNFRNQSMELEWGSNLPSPDLISLMELAIISNPDINSWEELRNIQIDNMPQEESFAKKCKRFF